MKKLLLILGLCVTFTAKADSIAMVVTGAASSNLLSTAKIINELVITTTTTNITTVKFYDSGTTSTNYIQAAYGRMISYATNYVVVFTNESSVLVTNTFSGLFTTPVATAIATNERPRIQTIIIPGSSQRTKIVNLQTMLGLTVVPSHDIIVEVDYRGL